MAVREQFANDMTANVARSAGYENFHEARRLDHLREQVRKQVADGDALLLHGVAMAQRDRVLLPGGDGRAGGGGGGFLRALERLEIDRDAERRAILVEAAVALPMAALSA